MNLKPANRTTPALSAATLLFVLTIACTLTVWVPRLQASAESDSQQRARLARLRDTLENRNGTGRMTREERALVTMRVAESRQAAEAVRTRSSGVDARGSLSDAGVRSSSSLNSTREYAVLSSAGQASSATTFPVYRRSLSQTAGTPPIVGDEPLRQPKPTAEPVPGKPGIVVSPFAPEQGYVDVRGLTSGMDVRDPYTGRIFVVP